MESANLLESSLYCCHRCKGLFSASDDKVKHQMNCMGNPMESSCAYFACERKVFLQLFQPDDFLFDGCDTPFLFSKDDSFINHFVKIRVPDIFDPSIFLKSASTFQPNQSDAEDTNFLIESNINTLEEEAEKVTGSTYVDPSKEVDPISEDRIQSIINKNIEYLKHDDIPSLSSGRNKVESSFSSSQSFPQLLSPIDKHLHLFGEGSKSRLHSPFERGSGLLQDGQLGYSSGSFMYSSNPSLPFSCGLSTDLFSSIPLPQEENQQTLPTNIEEFPTLQYLDLAKKDPFVGQNLGLSQINNAKDPFLINAALKTTERPTFGLQKSQITRSCEDLQSSPALPLQDGNYFNFPSTLDEPTQLDYLDLATLDFITNPNLINYAPINVKEKTYEKDQDIYSEDNITCDEPSSIRSEAVTRLCTLSDHGGSEGLSAFSRVKKKKKLRLKKSKSDIERRYENIPPQNRNSFLYPEIKEVFVKHPDLTGTRPVTFQEEDGKSVFETTDIKKCRKRRSDSPKGNKSESKLMKMNRKSYDFKPEKHLNVREKLTHLTEEQKDKMKAVLGQSGCIFVKKKRSLSCDEPVVYVNDSQVFGSTGLFREHSVERDDKFHPIKSNSRVLFDEQHKTRRLKSVLHLKCQECDFKCRSVIELNNHRTKHIKQSETELLEEKTNQSSQVSGMPKLLTDQQKVTEKNSEVSEQGMVYHSNASCHLEKIPEVAVVDELAGSKLFEADMSNTFTTSLSIPFVSENSEPNYCESIVNSEASKEVNASSTDTLPFVPVKMTVASLAQVPKTEKNRVSLLSQPSSSLFLNPDLSQETEMAVKAIENISSEFDKCILDKDEISSDCTSRTVLVDKNEADNIQRSDIDIGYEKSGLGLLNINSVEQDITDTTQSLSEEIKPFSTLTTVSLFQDENIYCGINLHDTEISKTVESNGSQDTELSEVINKDFEKLHKNGKTCKMSCQTDTDTTVMEEAFLAKDNILTSDNVEIDGRTIKNEGKAIEKKLKYTMSNDLIDLKSTSNNIFENFQVLVESSVENPQVLFSPSIENPPILVGPSVENPQVSNEHDIVITNTICDNIIESDMISEVFWNGQGMKETKGSDLKLNTKKYKHMDTIENPCPIPVVNPFVSLGESQTENVVIIEQSDKVEKLNKNVTDSVVGSYLEKLVDFVSSDNFESCQSIQQPGMLENIKSANDKHTGTTCEISAQTTGDPSVVIDKKNDLGVNVTDLNNICNRSINKPCEILNDQDNGFEIEALTNGSVIVNSTNTVGDTLIENALNVSTIQPNYCNDNMTGIPQCQELSLIDKGISSESLNTCSNDSDNALTDDFSNGKGNVPETVDSNNYSEILQVKNDSMNVLIKDRTTEIYKNVSGEDDASVNGCNVPILISVNENECNEAELDNTSGMNEPVIISIQNADEMLRQSYNEDVLTTEHQSTGNKVGENENDPDAFVGSTNHGEDVLSSTCISDADQNKNVEVKKGQTGCYPLSKVVEGKRYKKQVKERDGYFLCDVTGCQFKTQYKSNVGAHYKHVHLAIKKHKCEQCSYATPNKSSLKHHMQLNHLKEKKFKCPDCDYLSLFHSDVVKHVRHTHMKQKQYACNQCEYRTGHSHSLKLHIMSHNGIRPYKCSSCEYRANNANKVTRHIKLCHANEVGVSCIKEDLTFEIDAKQFQCEEIISYQDIKVIELSAEEADIVMKQREVKKEQEKEAKVMEKKAKEADKKAKRQMKKKEEEIANMSALNAIEKFSNSNTVSTKEMKVFKLTPETAKAFIEAKVAETTVYTDNRGETKRFTKILQKPKPLETSGT